MYLKRFKRRKIFYSLLGCLFQALERILGFLWNGRYDEFLFSQPRARTESYFSISLESTILWQGRKLSTENCNVGVPEVNSTEVKMFSENDIIALLLYTFYLIKCFWYAYDMDHEMNVNKLDFDN